MGNEQERRVMEAVMLHTFITSNRQDIIDRCRVKVSRRSIPPPTEAEIDHGVPLFLDQLVDALRGDRSNSEIRASAILHGHDLMLQGLTVSQVVHDYGDVCQSITDLAVETNTTISVQDFRTLNGCLDEAIAGAVTQFGRERMQDAATAGAARENERLGFFAHELRNLLQTAMFAFEVVKSGNVGIVGSTGTVLHRSLIGARDLIERSLAEVRLTEGVQRRERFVVSEFLDDLVAAATLEATSRRVHFQLVSVDNGPCVGAMVEADPALLAAVVNNVLQNAFKFTHPGTTVVLRVSGSAERVLIEVQDECGGLPTGDAANLFQPFEQRGSDRTGSGLGLAFCRWAMDASNGRIYARTLPGVGCVFTVDLPRVATVAPNPAPAPI